MATAERAGVSLGLLAVAWGPESVSVRNSLTYDVTHESHPFGAATLGLIDPSRMLSSLDAFPLHRSLDALVSDGNGGELFCGRGGRKGGEVSQFSSMALCDPLQSTQHADG